MYASTPIQNVRSCLQVWTKHALLQVAFQIPFENPYFKVRGGGLRFISYGRAAIQIVISKRISASCVTDIFPSKFSFSISCRCLGAYGVCQFDNFTSNLLKLWSAGTKLQWKKPLFKWLVLCSASPTQFGHSEEASLYSRLLEQITQAASVLLWVLTAWWSLLDPQKKKLYLNG